MRIRDLNGIAPHGGGLTVSADWGTIAEASIISEREL